MKTTTKKKVDLVLKITEATVKCHICKADLKPFILDNKINHYIKKHDGDILHIGQEDDGYDGDYMQYITAAYLGFRE